jgi:hypothetical protein
LLGQLPELDVLVLGDPQSRDAREEALAVERASRLGVGRYLEPGREALREGDVLAVDEHVGEQLVHAVLQGNHGEQVAHAVAERRRRVEHRHDGHDADRVVS